MFLKRVKIRHLFFFLQNYILKYFFNWKQFQIFKIVKFKFKVTEHYRL